MQFHRLGSPALAAWLAQEHDTLHGIKAKPFCATPRREPESAEARAKRLALDVPPQPANVTFNLGSEIILSGSGVGAPTQQEPAAVPKFKVGDRVRTIRGSYYSIGAAGTVTAFKGNFAVVKMDTNGVEAHWPLDDDPDWLELLPPSPTEGEWVEWRTDYAAPIAEQVMVKFAAGNTAKCRPGAFYGWDHDCQLSRDFPNARIVAYRIVKP